MGSNTSQPRRKTGGSGGLGGIPGFGSGSKKSSSGSASKPALDEFNHENGILLGSDRRGKKYVLNYGKSLYILGQNGSAAKAAAVCAENCKVSDKAYHFGTSELHNYTKVSSEADICLAVNSMNEGNTVFFIEDMMEFYKIISDEDLDSLIKILSDETKGNNFIIGANIDDAVILRDYPLGIFLFTANAAGMLAGCSASDAMTVLHTALLDNMTASERASIATVSMPLLFQKNGANSRIIMKNEEI